MRMPFSLGGLFTVIALTLVLGAEPALALPDCNKIPTPPRCMPDWEPPGYEKIYRLQPIALQVWETQDDGADEVAIAFSASHRWGPVKVNNGDPLVDLTHLRDWRFVNTAQSLTLSDLDESAGEGWWDPDDQLGFLVVQPSYADGSRRIASFTDHGAHYLLHYAVVYEGCREITEPCPS